MHIVFLFLLMLPPVLVAQVTDSSCSSIYSNRDSSIAIFEAEIKSLRSDKVDLSLYELSGPLHTVPQRRLETQTKKREIDSRISQLRSKISSAHDRANSQCREIKDSSSNAKFSSAETSSTKASVLVSELERLGQLFKEGLLTPEEFNSAKRALLGI